MRLVIPFILLSCGVATSADTPPKTKPLFPSITPAVQPVDPPRPSPGVIPVLSGDVQLVIASDEPFLLFDSPKGLVNIVKESGPIKVRGKFLDGSGKVETRNYTAKNIAIVTSAEGKGRVELIAVPQGLNDENKAERLIVDVNGAQPPPKPDDPVDPVPTKSFRVIFVYESGDTLTTAQHSVIYAKSVSDWLTANTTKDGQYAGWRRYDKDSDASGENESFKGLWAAVKPKVTTVPCVVIERNGKADILPLPATPAEAVALFTKYKEGK